MQAFTGHVGVRGGRFERSKYYAGAEMDGLHLWPLTLLR